MDLLRAEIAKSTQAVIENAKAYSVPTSQSSPTHSPSPAPPSAPDPVDLMGEPPLSPASTPLPTSPTQPANQPPLPSPGTATPSNQPQPTPPSPGQQPPTPAPPPGVPGQPQPAQQPGTPDPNDAGNRILEMILAELKAKNDAAKAAKDKLAEDKKEKEERAAALLTPKGIRDQQRAEREKENQAAYQRRVRAGQAMGDYDQSQNYRRRQNDPRYTRDQNRQFNNSAQARGPRQTGGGAGTAAARQATAAMSAFTGMILRAIGPIGIVVGMLTAVSSGFAQFQQVVDLLMTVLGGFLLPFFLLFGAALLSLTQIFMDRMGPAMEEFYEIVFQLIPVFDALLKVIITIYDLYMYMIVAIREFINFLGNLIRQKLTDGAEVALPGSGEILQRAREQAENFINEGKKKFGKKDGADVGDFRKALAMMIQSFKLSIGPKATLTGLDTAWNKKLLDAVNVDPIEAEKKRMLMKIIELLERALAKAEGQKAEAPVKGGDGAAQASKQMAPRSPVSGQQGIS